MIHPSSKTEDRSIIINGVYVAAERKKSLTRLLGIWLETELKETLVIKKAKAIVKQLTRTLQFKKLTIS